MSKSHTFRLGGLTVACLALWEDSNSFAYPPIGTIHINVALYKRLLIAQKHPQMASR